MRWTLTLTTLSIGSVCQAAIFPKDTLVQMQDSNGFKQVMEINQTSMVAFVASWCGHCKQMAPEYSKAALGLHPLVPFYAVDCDVESNKELCAEQGVQGFPTIKLFPRGKSVPSVTYEAGERTASGFYIWGSRGIPQVNQKHYNPDDVQAWIAKTAKSGKPRALLLTKDKKVPLLWQVLANKYTNQLDFASHRDRKGKSAKELGQIYVDEDGHEKKSKVFVYAPGDIRPVRYEGINKLDSLSKFFNSVIDGTADLKLVNEEAAKEEFVVDPKDEDIARKQEAQRLKLAHGGLANFIDFEDALKKGNAEDFHAQHGFGGTMEDVPKRKPDAENAKPESTRDEL